MLIVLVLRHCFPSWEAPTKIRQTGWTSCLCPSHLEENASASINLEYQAIKCQACGYKGDYLKVLMTEKKVGFVEACRIAEELASSSGNQVPRSTTRKRSRAAFGEQGSTSGNGREVPPRFRQ